MHILHERRANAVRNMALDEAILEACIIRGSQESVLRIYTWSGPSLSFGCNQRLTRAIYQRAISSGLDMVRRPSGGGAVLHDQDLTYCLVAPDPGGSTLDVYRWAAKGVLAGFRALGIMAEVVDNSGPADAMACFARSTGADIAVSGRKICGSAQVRRRGWILQHGSIPLNDSRRQAALIFGEGAKSDSTCLSELVPGIDWETAAAAFEVGFRASAAPEVVSPRGLYAEEELLTEALEAAHWMLGIQPAKRPAYPRLDVDLTVAEPSTYALESR